MIERTTLAPGLEIARVVTGLWQVADLERGGAPLDPAVGARALADYVAAGYSTFDLADHYGSAEDLVGAYRAANPGTTPARFLTKWVPRPGPIDRAATRAAVARSLERMGGEVIDLLQLHAWRYADPSWLDALFALEELVREGLVRAIGLTNMDTAHLRVAVESGLPIVSNQVSYSLLDRRPGAAMADYCLTRGIRLLVYGTVAGGWLSARWLGQPEPDWRGGGTWSEMKYGRFLEVAGGWAALQRLLAGLDPIARRLGVSISNLAARWVLDQPAVAAVIIGARLGQREHRADNARLFAFTLSPADRASIAALIETLDPIPGDSGDEYRRPPYLTASGDLSHHLSEMPAPYRTEARADGRTVCVSGTPWESIAGFSRAVRVGNRIMVSGTTATHGDRVIGGNDPTAQTHAIIDKIEGAILSLGGRLDQVVRTRVYVRDRDEWEPVARAHGERFAGIGPANTLVAAGLVGERYRVEIEAEAVVEP